MEKTARARGSRLSHLQRRSFRDRAEFPIPVLAADVKRSVDNILEWNSYLPADCVRIMVRMGWDYTT
jgi:hypothetical protein